MKTNLGCLAVALVVPAVAIGLHELGRLRRTRRVLWLVVVGPRVLPA